MQTVFYSWQSDLPNATNRGLIGSALEAAANAIHADNEIDVEPVVDRDTQGAAGAPEIASTIFSKVERAAVFVADVSIVGIARARPTPNPNVLVELGFAMGCLGTGRVVLVFNEAFGSIEQLPFDLRPRLVLRYKAHEAETDRATPRRGLSQQLEHALRAVFAANPMRPDRLALASGLSREARILLYYAAKDPQGTLVIYNVFGGQHVQTGERAWPIGQANARARAIWIGAVNELANQGFVEPRGYKGEVFVLTREGHDAAERFGLADD